MSFYNDEKKDKQTCENFKENEDLHNEKREFYSSARGLTLRLEGIFLGHILTVVSDAFSYIFFRSLYFIQVKVNDR